MFLYPHIEWLRDMIHEGRIIDWAEKGMGKETELKQRTTVDTGPQRNDAFISFAVLFLCDMLGAV